MIGRWYDRLISRSGKRSQPLKSVAEIGQLIRTERKAQGLRQDDLAAASGVGLRFIVDLERGKETVQLGKVLAVLAALGCSIELAQPGEGQGI
ncbi:helix-turn-helix transcriptional regulator [Novosphingobium gossypii]|uniref:helix-turn-helix transcriptional regulator n=1 Tax=Novosphingobium gossypii TaxID=1604774 RepID=UPI003D1C7F72